MSPERWQQITDLFEAALECSAPDRPALLAVACCGDEELRREVQSLLVEHETSAGFMMKSALDSTGVLNTLPPESLPNNRSLAPLHAIYDGLILKGRYRIEKELGSGGVGVVYLANDQQLHGRQVVIKALLDDSFRDPWFQKKFHQEIEALSRLDHPGIVGVSDTGAMPDGKPFYVMQYVEGNTLRSEINPGGMNLPRAGEIVYQIGQALTAAHERGILHLDLKPNNVMIQELGGDKVQVKLIDFGVAKIRDPNLKGSSDLTGLGGTLDYMAPEQAMGQASAASDTYALGLIACEIMTGQRVFKVGSTRELVEKQKGGRPIELRRLRSELPPSVEMAVMKALAFDPAERPEKARDLGEAVLRALSPARGVSRFPVVPRKWLIAAACVLVLVGALAWQTVPVWRQADALDSQPILKRIARPRVSFGNVSPDGKHVARTEKETIWIEQLDTGESQPLISQAGIRRTVWSKDSAHIAFGTVNPKDGNWQSIQTINVATGLRRTVMESTAGPAPEICDWMPDNTQLLCKSDLADNQVQLALVSIDSGSMTPIISTIGQSHGAQLSPDGRFTAYAAQRNGNWDIYVAQVAAGGTEVRLTNDISFEGWPLWSPDGESVLYGRNGDVWGVRVDRQTGSAVGEPYRLARGVASNSWSLTRDGELYYETSKELPPRIFDLDLDQEAGQPKSESLSSLAEGTGWPFWWSGGGNHFYYSSPSLGLVERDLSSGQERVVKMPKGYVGIIETATPGGQSFLFSGWTEDGKQGVYEYIPASGRTSLIWETKHHINPPLSVSPDGQEVLSVFYLAKEQSQSVQVLDRSSRRVRELVRTPTQPYPRWSPDGREVAFTDGDCLKVVAGLGGQPRQIVCAPKSGVAANGVFLEARQLCWSPDARKLVWTVHNQEARRVDLWVVDYFTGDHTVWPGESDYRSRIVWPSWSPDGKRIAFQKLYAREVEEWKLSNFLPAHSK